MRSVLKRIRRIIYQPDFRKNPLKALLKRFIWRLRWVFNQEPWILRLKEGPYIFVSRNMGVTLYYYNGEYEPETVNFIKKLLKPGMVFFDVGAHIGVYTLIAAKLVGENGQVHAFEPVSEACALLHNSVILNNLDNVKINQIAISDEEREELSYYVYEKDSSVSSFLIRQDRSAHIAYPIRVRTTTLDIYCLEASLNNVDCIKVDVEGAELKVLRGAHNLLSRCSPVLIIEVSAKNFETFGYSVNDLFHFLFNYGYSTFIYRDEIVRITSEYASNLSGFFNIIAYKDPAIYL